jgi:sec-independent protein translocase protein TatA
MPTFGPLELVLILVIVTMLFGVGKLPEVFGSVGKGIREFRRNSTLDAEDKKVTTETETEVVTTPAVPAGEVTTEARQVETNHVESKTVESN